MTNKQKSLVRGSSKITKVIKFGAQN